MELFILATVINVIFSTVRSLLTIKGTPLVASITNAITYGFYSYVIVLTANGEVSLVWKIVITALANFIGVYLVKLIEKKMTKDKLWKIDFSVNKLDFAPIENKLQALNIPYCYNEHGKHTMFSAFAETQADSHEIAKLVKAYGGKYFISENKGILE